MKKSDVLKYFNNSPTKVGNYLGISQASVSQWPEQVPEASANRLARKTEGEERNGVVLQFKLSDYFQAEKNDKADEA